MSDLHTLLPRSAGHTVIDYHHRVMEAELTDLSFEDLAHFPAWFRYACKYSKEGAPESSIASSTMKLIARPGTRAQQVPTGAIKKVAKKIDASQNQDRAKAAGSKIPPAALDAAKLMLSADEFVDWDRGRWADACIACAEVFAVDDHLQRELHTLDDTVRVDSRSWSLKTRIHVLHTKVTDFRKWKMTTMGRNSRTTQPDVDDLAKRLSRALEELERLDQVILSVTLTKHLLSSTRFLESINSVDGAHINDRNSNSF
jgi:hypothetical protein